MLRGPIRRRPYNRGKIIAMKRGEMIPLNHFYWPISLKFKDAMRSTIAGVAGGV